MDSSQKAACKDTRALAAGLQSVHFDGGLLLEAIRQTAVCIICQLVVVVQRPLSLKQHAYQEDALRGRKGICDRLNTAAG